MQTIPDRRKTIYVFSTAYAPFVGGAEIAIRETIRSLESKYRFVVLTARLRRDLAAYEDHGVYAIARIGIGHPIDKLLLLVLGPWRLWKLARQNPPALYWAVMVSFASAIPYIANFFRWRRVIPIVLTLQEGDPESHIRYGRGGLIGLSWRLALRRADHVTVISRYLGDLARRFGARAEIEVIPNGVDRKLFSSPVAEEQRQVLRRELGLVPKDRVLISTSRLVRKNGLDILIRSLGALPMSLRSHIKLVLVGRGMEETFLRDLAKSEGLANQVIFLGEKSYESLPQYLAVAEIFVRPSRSEGMGNSFIEAMAAGLPVIGTSVGGITDFLQDRVTGLMVKPERIDLLAQAVATFLDDLALRQHCIANGRALVLKRYGWSYIAKVYAEVFDDAIKRARFSRILVATGIYPPEIGGSAKYAALLSGFFRERGWQVEVITYSVRRVPRRVRRGGDEGEFLDIVSASDTLRRKPPDVLRFGARTFYGESSHARPGVYYVSRRWPTGVRHVAAFLQALVMMRRSEVVILFDHFSMGLPVGLVAWVFRRPVVIRVGGDFLWESYVESHRTEITLPGFYESRPFLNWKERTILFLARWTLRHASRVAFSTEWQRQIFIKHYGLLPERTLVIQNSVNLSSAVSETFAKRGTAISIVYAGRFLFLKNLRRTLLVFRSVRLALGSSARLYLIGEGPEEGRLKALIQSYGMMEYVYIEPPLDRVSLEARILGAAAVIIPSLSDVSPNLVVEALELGVPVLLTKHCGYTFGEAEGVLRVDPLDENDLARGFSRLLNSRQRSILKQNVHPVTTRTPHPSGRGGGENPKISLEAQAIRSGCNGVHTLSGHETPVSLGEKYLDLVYKLL